MHGKIELVGKFKDDWRFGYIVTNKEPRRNVVLYNSHEDRSTISYAKYLYETSLNVTVSDGFVVDHIDGDQMNDVLSNFQVISVKENNEKRFQQSNGTRLFAEFNCGTCSKTFSKPHNRTHLTITHRKSTYCSRVCGGKRLQESVLLRLYRK